MLRRSLLALGFLAAVVMACSQESAAKPERICTPDAYVFCRCQDRQEGTKHCKEDGISFEECLPCDGSGNSGVGSGGSDGLGSGHGTDAPRSPKSGGGKTPPPDGEGEGEGEGDPGNTGDTDAGGSNPSTPDSGTRKDSGTTSSGGSTSGGSTSGGSTSGGTSGGASTPNAAHCKPLKNIGPRIELQKLADEPEPAKGGTPKDGLYVQSWVIEFTGEDGQTGPSKHYSRETLEITGDVGRYVFEDDDGTKAAGGFRLHSKGNNKVEVAYECPAAEPKDLAYDATANELIIYDPPYARVFIRQQTGGTK